MSKFTWFENECIIRSVETWKKTLETMIELEDPFFVDYQTVHLYINTLEDILKKVKENRDEIKEKEENHPYTEDDLPF